MVFFPSERSVHCVSTPLPGDESMLATPLSSITIRQCGTLPSAGHDEECALLGSPIDRMHDVESAVWTAAGACTQRTCDCAVRLTRIGSADNAVPVARQWVRSPVTVGWAVVERAGVRVR